MAYVSIRKYIGRDVQTVWQYVSEWGGTSRWIPGVGVVSTVGAGVGATRSAELSAETGFPGIITERLDVLDENNCSFRYSTVGENPLPVKEYSAQMTVEPSGEGSIVTWSSDWEPDGISEDELKESFEQLYTISLDNVERELESS